MKSFSVSSVATAAIVATSLLVSRAAAAVDPIVIKGSKFFYKTNGTQFFIRGVAYQQDYNGNGTAGYGSNDQYTDPLININNCNRDIPYLLQLNTNTIRVYAVDPTRDHSACMAALANAGIYVIADLSSPTIGQNIDRSNPQWNDGIYARYTAVVDAFQNYTNVLGFFAGNEVSNAPNNTNASAFVKAAVRDMKAYIKSKNYRTIGVGYATNDDADIRVNMADYFNCGDASSAIDFWGYNIYSWCGESSYTASGYDVRTQEFSTYSVPAFFAEYGCNNVEPRPFTEVQALYGPNMSTVWSGGIAYQYFQEANNYGLVTVSGQSVTTNQDFSNLKTQLASISPSSVASASYTPTNSPQACPSVGGNWSAAATPLPPTPNQQVCSCMYNSLGCVVAGSTSEDNYGSLFGTVCGYGSSVCAGITSNATTGTYGAFGMCNATEQLAYAFNNYYVGQHSSASACNFGGAATSKAAASASGACSTLLAQAGTAGTGTVTSSPTGTAASGSAPSVESGVFAMAFIVTIAAVSGMGMILL
ncbi:carbohydrate-binding module family 43 protein [Baudoinia panamericana UAMH 10762]|uniref:1,3-beta-glucanosyltransferase n=1 Tax=Baudoinia panamericana (strain UAMH 10762) TaxID=717646 RepID=M2NLC1_BAUPA|nr:carbohydrate-binding module family 43 protein [Baudoinia panamericana UAMH 10762]EMC99955.1 carbohydrate-binding module family 43 protein [Baudoinia panamericana UAMH 10762]